MLIDTHAHLYAKEYETDISEVVLRAKQKHVEKVILPNIDISTIKDMKKLVRNYPDFFLPTIGIHPSSVKEDYQKDLDLVYKELNLNGDFIAIGEIGIDLYWDTNYKSEQIKTFETQLKWSIEKDLPVIIHARNSYSEIVESVKRVGENKLKGIFHSFSGDADDLENLLNFDNFYIGINGIVTFKNSNLRTVLKNCPPEKIVLETDAPYLTPTPNRGKRNEPMYLEQINQTLSDIYGITAKEMSKITRANALQIFELSL